MGRPFFGAKLESIDALLICERLAKIPPENGIAREYPLDDCLIVYVHAADAVHLVPVRHMKQLSFDFEHLWLGGR
ncbi:MULTISPECIES: hypothetical protein [unclassified Caballeronia]|uniref:hypothetical protein n=1 Tax=unclassified Caballeronia TaxID=2646786 RepID=UPI002866977F|nr:MULTISPECIES: hypothetical protein [unclassified Caballeronia]MDR5749936.1 hypothetical protein [Caballeronia sp. LZ024]MDR5842936.1 hypothetical protein [Caballeronia sp. LZ031]